MNECNLLVKNSFESGALFLSWQSFPQLAIYCQLMWKLAMFVHLFVENIITMFYYY